LLAASPSDPLTLTLTGDLDVSSGGMIGSSSVTTNLYLPSVANVDLAGTSYANFDKVVASGSFTVEGTGKIYGNIGSPNTSTDPGVSAASFTVASGGTISADNLGYAGGLSGTTTSGNGSGTGGGIYNTSAGGGGGHGGAGASGGTGSEIGR